MKPSKAFYLISFVLCSKEKFVLILCDFVHVFTLKWRHKCCRQRKAKSESMSQSFPFVKSSANNLPRWPIHISLQLLLRVWRDGRRRRRRKRRMRRRRRRRQRRRRRRRRKRWSWPGELLENCKPGEEKEQKRVGSEDWCQSGPLLSKEEE